MELYMTIKGEVPAKKNSRINTHSGRSFPSVRFQQWHTMALLQLRQQCKETITTPCRIDLTFIHGDNRRRDSDNGTSSVFDTLVDAGILSDDSWREIPEINIKNIYKKDCPEVQIMITKLTN